MSGYFDEDEPEPEATPARARRDREMTLSTGASVGLVAGLVLLCGLCFGAGYAVGHRGQDPATAGPTSPDQGPMQPNGSIPKPSASAQTGPQAPQPSDSTTTPDPQTPAAETNPTPAQQSPRAKAPDGTGPDAPPVTVLNPPAVQPVRAALPGSGNMQPAGQTSPNVRAALPSQGQWVVQIAAVANSDDADVLVAALRRRGYSVLETREPVDGLIHVRIGPFSTHDEANRWRDKLLGGGYNAVVQP